MIDKIYKTQKEATDAALESDAIVRGDEIFVLYKDSTYVVTEHPDEYKDWENIDL